MGGRYRGIPSHCSSQFVYVRLHGDSPLGGRVTEPFRGGRGPPRVVSLLCVRSV